MDLQTFRDSIAKPQPPAGLGPALQALWWDAKGDWDKAHERAQERDDTGGHACACIPPSQGRRSIECGILVSPLSHRAVIPNT